MEERILEKKIVKDILFLSQVSQPASQEDLPLAKDLQDTLLANREKLCWTSGQYDWGTKTCHYFNIGMIPMVMFNPVLQSFEGSYETEEGCLSLTGVRPTTRYEKITVSYRDIHWQEQTITLTGFPAQICQHELDHLDGIII